MTKIPPGKKFKLNKSVNFNNLYDFGYPENMCHWILKQNCFIAITEPEGYSKEKYTWYKDRSGESKPFYHKWTELFNDKGYNHPLSPIFK